MLQTYRVTYMKISKKVKLDYWKRKYGQPSEKSQKQYINSKRII